jgi:hypothetical protein
MLLDADYMRSRSRGRSARSIRETHEQKAAEEAAADTRRKEWLRNRGRPVDPLAIHDRAAGLEAQRVHLDEIEWRRRLGPRPPT